MSSFKNSYSAAKASIEEAYQRFQVSRKILERTFCQPIYEEFVLGTYKKRRNRLSWIFLKTHLFVMLLLVVFGLVQENHH